MRGLSLVAVVLVGAAAGACARDEGTTLDRDAFYRPPPGTRVERHVLQDSPSGSTYNNLRVDLMSPQPQVNILQPESQPAQESVTEISKAVRESVESPLGNEPSPGGVNARPSTAPVARPRPGTSSGVAMLIGGVVCEVNGNPIYADKILSALSKVLAAEAQTRDERSFRAFAQKEIEKQLFVLINAELEFAIAKKNLDPREVQLAEEYTARWRQQLITQAGGSLERARAKAAADGWEFDDLVAEEFRTNVVRIYLQKKVYPQAQVRADDVRQYYNQHVKSEFTEIDQARFRVIKIDIKKTGSETQAQDKIENLRQRALRGEDFAAMAASFNDEPSLMRSAGDVGWMQRGAYRLEELEQAVWRIQIGDVTEVVKISDALYIAKLDERKTGRIQPFEEQAVQDKIIDTLRKEQIRTIRERQRQALIRDAVIYPDPPDITPVLEMAMQKYTQWASVDK